MKSFYQITLTQTDGIDLVVTCDEYSINRKGRFITAVRHFINYDEVSHYPFNFVKRVRITKIEQVEDFNV